MKKLLAPILPALLVALAGCGDSAADANARDARLQIAVIPKGTTHEFWKAIHAGAARAAEQHGVDIHWKGPLQENDRAQQIQVVQQFVSQGIDGIALAPLDSRALVAPVAAAGRAGIPLVVFDSALDGTPGEDFVSFVATDNRLGGRIGGEHLAKLLGGRGKVVLLRYQVGSASTTNREAGFLEAMRAHAGIEIIVDREYSGATAGEAKTKALNLLDRLRVADGIFCPNESSTNGMLLALRQEGLAGEIRFVGFDASPPLVAGLEAGEIDALVVQDPLEMGRLAVDTLVRHIRGETVTSHIDTAVALATRSNMGEPEVRRLLK